MRGTQVVRRGLLGGWNTLDSVYELAPNEARDLRNVVATARGAIRKRSGSQTLTTLPASGVSLYGSLLPRYLLAADGTELRSVDPTGAQIQLATGLTAGRRWQFSNAPSNGGQGPIYGMNGAEARYTNGTSAGTGTMTASAGTLPVGQYLVYNQSRLFVAGMTSYGTFADPGSCVAVSNIGNPRDFAIAANAAYVVQFDPNDGEAISGVGTIGPYVIVFKPSKAWLIYDLDTGANRRLGQNVGCVSARSIVETPQGTFFLSKDQGVMLASQQSAQRVSDKILPTLTSIAATQAAGAIGAYWNQHYYLAVSLGGAFNDLLLDFDMTTGSWWAHSLACQDLVVWQQGNQPLLYALKGGAATIRQLFVSGLYQDDVPAGGGAGANFTSYYRAAYDIFGAPDVKKRVTELALEGYGHFRVMLSRDFAVAEEQLAEINLQSGDGSLFGVDDGSLFGVDDGTVFGPGSSVLPARIPSLGTARAFGLGFINDTDDDFQIDSWTLAYRMRRD